jgi:hypothetical protein
MFKRRVEDSGKTTMFRFACRIFYAHVVSILIMLVIFFLVDNLKLIGLEQKDSVYNIAVTVACLVFYLVYNYIQCWRIGQRDYNQVLYKHITYNKWKPLLAAVYSQIPGLILAVLAVIPSTRELGRSVFSVFYFYAAWLLARFKDTIPAIYFVPLLLPLILTPAAYHMGYRGIYLANKVVYNMPKEKRKDKQGRA